MDCLVTLDGEEVKFKGEIPETIASTLNVLWNYLQGFQKIFSKIYVDKKPLDPSCLEIPLSKITTLDCFSKDFPREEVRTLFSHLKQAFPTLNQLLTSNFEDTLKVVGAFTEQLKQFLFQLESMHLWLFLIISPTYLQGLQILLECLEKKDLGTMIDCLEVELKSTIDADLASI